MWDPALFVAVLHRSLVQWVATGFAFDNKFSEAGTVQKLELVDWKFSFKVASLVVIISSLQVFDMMIHEVCRSGMAGICEDLRFFYDCFAF